MKNSILMATGIALILSLSATTCEKSKPCPEDVICTAIFAAVMVHVHDAAGNPVMFDEVYTVRVSNNETIHIDQHMEQGNYFILDDSYREKLANKSESFRFIGMKNGQLVVEETYVISADCCHIQKQSGKEEIIL